MFLNGFMYGVFYRKFELACSSENFCENSTTSILYFLIVLFPRLKDQDNE